MRAQSDREADWNVGRLIEAYDQYIQLLGDSEAALISVAMIHGFRCPEEMVRRGEELRARIAELKVAALEQKVGGK